MIFLIVSELFGVEVALIAAALWAFDPTAIGFNRVAKEDSFLLFFFLLANVFWLRGQRVAESTDRNPNKYYWATAASLRRDGRVEVRATPLHDQHLLLLDVSEAFRKRVGVSARNACSRSS